MTVSFTLNQSQVDEIKRKLSATRDGLKSEGVAMRQVSIYLDQWVQRNFKGAGWLSGGWAKYMYGGRLVRKSKANAQSIDGKRYIDGAAKLLQDTGALRMSFLPFVRKGIAGIGSDLPYSEPHEKGQGIIQRRMLPKDEEVQPKITQILDNFVLIQLRKAQ